MEINHIFRQINKQSGNKETTIIEINHIFAQINKQSGNKETKIYGHILYIRANIHSRN